MELEVVHLVSLCGFLGALVFGAVANKTQFCIMGSISDWINMGSRIRFRAWVLAMGIAVIGAQLLAMGGYVDLSQSIYLGTSFGLGGYVVGGFLFGVGMTLGSGCGQKTLVRVGGGNLKSVVVLLVLALTAYATLRGLLAYVRIDVVGQGTIDLAEHGLAGQGIPTFVESLLGLEPGASVWPIAAVIGLGAVAYAFKDGEFRRSGDNIVAGVVIGLLAAGAWYVTGHLGNDEFEPVPVEGLTFIAPAGNTLNYLMTYTGSVINFGIAVVFGVIAGSFLYAVVSGTFRIETFVSRSDMVSHLWGGALMGFGGVLSLGCTVGQGVTGMSTLSLGSVVAVASIVLGSAVTLKVQYYMLDEAGFRRALHSALADWRLLPQPRSS